MDNNEIAERLRQARERIREELASSSAVRLSDALPPEQTLELGQADDKFKLAREPELNSTAHLQQANDLAVITGPAELTSRVAVLGPLLTFLRRLIRPFVQPLIDPYLDRQERFNVELVRHLNELGERLEKRLEHIGDELAHRMDDPGLLESRLDAALSDYDEALRRRQTILFDALDEEFWSVGNRVRDLGEAMDRQLHEAQVSFVERAQAVDQRFEEKDAGNAAALETLSNTIGGVDNALVSVQETVQGFQTHVEELERDLRQGFDQHQHDIREELRSQSIDTAELMETRAKLESVLERAGAAGAAAAGATAPGATTAGSAPGALDAGLWRQLREWIADADYRAFQLQFRGDEGEIARRMRDHVGRFEGVEGPIADLGCGRGEFLELLRDAGHEAIGVEINVAEVETCNARGLTAVHADLFDWLDEQRPGSLGGIFMAQVIEHLPPPDWSRLVQLAASRLGPGGRLVVETINPESLYALARAYVADPTHVRPVHPQLLEFLAGRAGFESVEIVYQAEVPAAERVVPIDDAAFVGDDRMEALAAELNDRLARVDRLICAPQEYSMVATRLGGRDASR